MVFLAAGSGHANPALSTFGVVDSQNDGVQVVGETVVFTETDLAAQFFYNDSFDVPLTSSISFYYDFDSDSDGEEGRDSFRFTLSYQDPQTSELISHDFLLATTTSSAPVSYDLTPWGGQTVIIEWGLIWGGHPAPEDTSGNGYSDLSTATISNINLTRNSPASPVPVPGTMVLMATGLAILARVGRKS
jgi:hypothetical protein